MSYYHIDTKTISLEKLRKVLDTKELLKGRLALKDNLHEYFDILEVTEIRNMHVLLEALKTEKRQEQFSWQTNIPLEYLILLRREANSYISPPQSLKSILFDYPSVIDKLEKRGIKNSKHFFDLAFRKKERQALSNELEVKMQLLDELISMCDLLRISGVGPVFARFIYDTGINSVQKFMNSEAEDLLTVFNERIVESGVHPVKLSMKDIQYCFDLGSELPQVKED